MKKTLKVLLLIAFMALILFSLTGCGNKLVATRETDDEEMGKIKEEVVYNFKDDKIDSVKMTFKFEDKETAEKGEEQLIAMKSLISAFGEDEINLDVKRSGKKVTMELDASAFAAMEGSEESINKDELKEELEEEGYKVK